MSCLPWIFPLSPWSRLSNCWPCRDCSFCNLPNSWIRLALFSFCNASNSNFRSNCEAKNNAQHVFFVIKGMYVCRGWVPNFATGLIYQIGHSSKSIWVTRLLFCQHGWLMGDHFGQRIAWLLIYVLNYAYLEIWAKFTLFLLTL